MTEQEKVEREKAEREKAEKVEKEEKEKAECSRQNTCLQMSMLVKHHKNQQQDVELRLSLQLP
jgi:hypothetical protein